MPSGGGSETGGEREGVALTVIHFVLYLVSAVITLVDKRVGLGSPRGSSVPLGSRELHW